MKTWTTLKTTGISSNCVIHLSPHFIFLFLFLTERKFDIYFVVLKRNFCLLYINFFAHHLPVRFVENRV